MSAEPARFERAEFEVRLTHLQAGLVKAGCAALLLTSAADIYYVTGFLTRFWESPTRPWFVVVPASGYPIAVIPSIGSALMAETWIDDIRTWPSPAPEDDGVSLLAETLREVVPSSGRIGLPMGAETSLRMPLGDYVRLRDAVAPRLLVDATGVIRRVREVKSEGEIEHIRAACDVAGAAFDRVPEFASPGRPLDAVFRDFQCACLTHGADWVSYLAGGAGPGGYTDVISPATSRPLENGDVLMLDTGIVRHGYFCDFDRNYSVGVPSDAVRRAHGVLFTATAAGIEAAQPGATAAEVHAAVAASIVRQAAKPLDGRLGHGLGLALTEWPSLLPGDHTVLRKGMVLTIEPGVEVDPGRIMVHEENIVVRAGGAELLSPRAPTELPVLV
jgi:Xaa-Pro aminopeptidase